MSWNIHIIANSNSSITWCGTNTTLASKEPKTLVSVRAYPPGFFTVAHKTHSLSLADSFTASHWPTHSPLLLADSVSITQ